MVQYAGSGYHRRGSAIGAKIYTLLSSLTQSTYNEISPKIEFWIEYALSEQSIRADDLVQHLSYLPWNCYGSGPVVARFLREFREAPHRSKKARSFVDKLCSRVLRWFAAASAEGLSATISVDQYGYERPGVAVGGGEGFIRAASFVGSLIEGNLLSQELVCQNLAKPLIFHHYTDPYDDVEKSIRAKAIYELFVTARDTLLQGFLDPEDVQACFEALNTNVPWQEVAEPGKRRVAELRNFYVMWLKRDGKECTWVDVVPLTPFTDDHIATVSSSTLNISATCDSALAESGEDTKEVPVSRERIATHQEKRTRISWFSRLIGKKAE